MKKLILILFILVFSLVYPSQIAGLSTKWGNITVKYDINVVYNGTALVDINIHGAGSGTAFLYLPHNISISYNMQIIEGNVKTYVKYNPAIYFYHCRFFEYNGEFRIKVSFTFPYAVLMAGKRAWFMSPLINFSNNIYMEVSVHLPNLKTIIKSYPIISWRNGDILYYKLYSPPPNKRIAVDYQLKEGITEVNITRTIANGASTLIFQTHPFYEEIVDKIALIMNKAYPKLKEVFGDFPNELHFKFYLPSLLDLSTLGYVMSEIVSTGEKGPVYLNLALLRFKEGYLEEVTIHEYVHVALGRIGVKAVRNLRWVHEGLAEYLAMEILKELGYDVSDMEKLRMAAYERYQMYHSLGELVYWPTGPEETLYYGAAYYVIKTLGDEYGGLNFYSRVFQEIKARGGIKTTKAFIECLISAGGYSIYYRFKSWGFNMEDLGNPFMRQLRYILLVIVLTIAIVIFAVYFLKRTKTVKQPTSISGLTRCPYCGAIVDESSMFCPYCGRELRRVSFEQRS